MEEAFIVAKLGGRNGREIREKEKFVNYKHKRGERPMATAKSVVAERQIQNNEKTAGCILLKKNLRGEPKGTNGYLFFGY